MMEMMEDREVRRLNLELLPLQPSRKSRQGRKKKKTLGYKVLFLKCNKVVQIQNCETVWIMKHIDLRRYVAMRK